MFSIRRYHAVALLSLALASAWTTAVSASTTTGIEVDGNYLDDPIAGEDWFPGFPPMTDPFGSLDDSLCGSSPAPKNDITNYFLANNDDFLFIGLERLANTGQTSFFLSFDVTGDGPSKGDFIFVFCFGSGSKVTDTYVLEWDDINKVWARDSTPPRIDFMVNTTRVPAPFKAFDRHGRPEPFIDTGKFAEAAIDLSSIEGFDICDANAVTAELQTKSSCSLSSECKDTTGPFIFSFAQLTARLEVRQDNACDPVIHARANAVGPRAPIAYTWYLDGVELTGPTFNSDEVSIPVPAGQCDEHLVKVKVQDSKCVVEDEAPINLNFPPAAAFQNVSTGACDLVLGYDGGASTDCDGDPLAFAWDFDGDGITDSTAASGNFLYPTCGPRTVSLVVNDGQCDSPAISVPVYANQAPVAGLQITALDCLEVSFLDTSVDCDLTQVSPLYSEKLSRVIDFGDGSPAVTDPSGTHQFPDCGSYDVTLTETDAMGCSSTATRKVSLTVSVTVN